MRVLYTIYMNPDTIQNTSNTRVNRIIYIVLAATLILIGVVAFRCMIDCGRPGPGPVVSVDDTKDMSGVNEFKLEQDIQTQTLKDIDIEERSTDIKVIYPDGYTFIIDSNYVEPVTNLTKVDINFDGVQDVLADISLGAYNMGADFYVQDPKTRTFTRFELTGKKADDGYEAFPGLGFVTINEKERTLESYFKGRGLGDIYTIEIYSFADGAWSLSSRESQDIYVIPGISGDDGWGPYYVNEVVDYTKNPPATTTTYLKLNEEQGEYAFEKIEKPRAKK